MQRPAFYFLVCPDAELARAELERLVAAHGAGGFERRAYFGDEELPARFWQDLGSPGLLGGSKLVLLRRAETLKADAWKDLSPRLAGFNEACWPVFCIESAWQKGSPKIPAYLAKSKPWEAAKTRGWIWQSPGLTRKTLPGFVQARLKAEGLRAAPQVLEAMCARLPEDASAVANEIAKLSLALPGAQDAHDREIRPEHLDMLTSAEGLDVWSLLEAIQEGGGQAKVWRHVLGQGGEDALFPLIFGLTREVRTLWMLASGEGGKVRLPPWLAEKKEHAARRLGQARLAEALGLALDAELSVKSGEKSDNQALELLVAGLLRLFGPAPQGAGRPSHMGRRP